MLLFNGKNKAYKYRILISVIFLHTKTRIYVQNFNFLLISILIRIWFQF